MPGNLAEQVGQALVAKQYMLVTAESCTGGWVAKLITDVAGSSAWFDRGFVTYTNEAKQEMLGVKASMLASQGAVSLATVEAMAEGALIHSNATVAISVSGIAGPGGGSDEKPVGTVCFSWKIEGQAVISRRKQFNGDRNAIRQQSVEYVLKSLLEVL